MLSRLLLILRMAFAWYLLALLAFVLLVSVWGPLGNPVAVIGLAMVMLAIVCAYSHVRRVRLLSGSGFESLGNRHVRRVELPLPAEDAFALVDALIRSFAPHAEVISNRGSLRVLAQLPPPRHWMDQWLGRFNFLHWFVSLRNQLQVTLTPAEASTSVVLLCQPQCATWSDWFRVDDGVNLDNAETLTHLLTRRVADSRRDERAAAVQTATQKELAIARLSLLQAQVEPHFLYNTLASAQILVRSDAAAADAMLGHLIQYLRHSLPSAEHTLSTLDDELQRSRAYLQIMQVRMGARLAFKLEVPDDLLRLPLPPMMLQTLVENAIKHGLEPKPEGGQVWIFARRNEAQVAITVADDGGGFSAHGEAGGIGLANVRQRLQLIYGTHATLSVAANFPAGVAATLIVPAEVAAR